MSDQDKDETRKPTVTVDKSLGGYTKVMPDRFSGDVNSQLVPIILMSIKKAKERHGELTKDPVRALAIVTEELGEAMAEALTMTYNGHINAVRVSAIVNMKIEVAQLAGTALLLLQNLMAVNGLDDLEKYTTDWREK